MAQRERLNSRTDEWKAVGLVVVNQRAVAVSVDTPLLVFDTDSWVRTVIENFECAANRARSEGDEDGYGAMISTVQELESWLKDRKITKSVFPVAFRQTFTPAEVNKDTLKPYLHKVMSLGRLAHTFEDFEFMLDVDAHVPTLYAVSRLKAQVRHTGNSIYGETVDQNELEQRIAEVKLRMDGVLQNCPQSMPVSELAIPMGF